MDNITPKEIADEEMINQAFQELLNDYLHTKHRKRVEIITKAFNFANQAHKGIKRRSGEPYIMHPIAVAQIVCNEIGLGSTSICAALLHDVVEDTLCPGIPPVGRRHRKYLWTEDCPDCRRTDQNLRRDLR